MNKTLNIFNQCFLKVLKFKFIAFLFLLGGPIIAQNSLSFTFSNPTIYVQTVPNSPSIEYLYFENAEYNTFISKLPSKTLKTPVSASASNAVITLNTSNKRLINDSKIIDLLRKENLTNQPQVSHTIVSEKGTSYLSVTVLPFIKEGSNYYIVNTDVSYKLQFNGIKTKDGANVFASSSVLAVGEWHKVGVTQTGLYKIDYAFMKSLGYSDSELKNSLPKVYGNGGGQLSFDNSAFRRDDLKDNAIIVVDGNDNSFDQGDYIVFYGQSPHTWRISSSSYAHNYHKFSDSTYYFITLQPRSAAKFPGVQPNENTSDFSVNYFDEHQFYEQDLVNLIKSGREWYGESFNVKTSQSFQFIFSNIDLQKPVQVKANFLGRTITDASNLTVEVPNLGSQSFKINPILNSYLAPYGTSQNFSFTFNPTSPTFNVVATYSKGNSTANAWLNWIEVIGSRKLIATASPLFFRNKESIGKGITAFTLSNVNANTVVYDVTDPTNIKRQELSVQGTNAVFRVPTDSLKQFVAFDLSTKLQTPFYSKKVANQNLHAVGLNGGIEYIVVTHPSFLSYAKDLADFHEERDGFTTVVATTEEIYNEFSSGAQDIKAIRDFIRMFYKRANGDSGLQPKYVLLFGDASYDFKSTASSNSNFIPSYQSLNSVSPTGSYITDDFFGFLDDNESDELNQLLDVGIGRLPVSNATQAANAVQKIKRYYAKDSFGDWRTNVTFVGDDEDESPTLLHMVDANRLATKVDTTYCDYNIYKIYLDAYQKVRTSGDARYPDVNRAIDERIRKGTLIFNYVGHGGELGLAYERIVGVDQINDWVNDQNMPLFVTATCEFTRFDDPNRTSAGEFVFLNPVGGAIALLTTTRLVYSSPNFVLSQAFNNIAFERINGKRPTIGDIVLYTKNNADKNVNTRCFSLIGDPGVTLSYPDLKVVPTSVPDTLSGLSKVTVAGYVADNNGNKLDWFNGEVYPTVFDRLETKVTLDNNGWGPFTYEVQNKVIFKGRASVVNGEFEFTFVVPKDISYTYGQGRISFYAQNGDVDAAGCYEDFLIGGTGGDATADEQGPTVQLFMNDESFVRGGITNLNPNLFAKVFDENGINTVGNGIGHDIVAVLDENTANAIVLNDYYESEKDNYQRGTIRYPFENLTEGKHTLSLKVWDVYNNSSTAETEFIVANDENMAISHVLNYPNPFTTNTGFYFEHNMPEQSLQVQVQIFTVSGKLVKSIQGYYNSNGFRVGPINWDGRDEFGDKIGKGVYLYKIEVNAPSGAKAEKFEKLVILN